MQVPSGKAGALGDLAPDENGNKAGMGAGGLHPDLGEDPDLGEGQAVALRGLMQGTREDHPWAPAGYADSGDEPPAGESRDGEYKNAGDW
jgi:hypothetical protein